MSSAFSHRGRVWRWNRWVVLLLVVLACVRFIVFMRAGAHVSDDELLASFALNRADFDYLLQNVNGFPTVEMISADAVRYGAGAPGGDTMQRPEIRVEVLTEFRRRMKRAGVEMVTKTGGGQVRFRCDGGSILSGDSVKGIVFMPSPPEGVLVESLDGFAGPKSYRGPRADFFYRHIEGGWYLYLTYG